MTAKNLIQTWINLTGKSNAELAEELGVAQSTVQAWRLGTIPRQRHCWQALAGAMRASGLEGYDKMEWKYLRYIVEGV